MLRIFAVQIPLYGIGIVLTGLLQAHRRFVAPAVAPLLSSLVVITTYLTYGALADGATDPAAVNRTEHSLALAWGTTTRRGGPQPPAPRPGLAGGLAVHPDAALRRGRRPPARRPSPSPASSRWRPSSSPSS